MKLNSLQLLRAVAIGLVVYAHSIDLQMEFSVSRQQSFFYLQNFGAIGVDLFFVISGFVITLVAYRYMGAEDGKQFLVKRFLRINPIYYLASLVFLGIVATAAFLLHDPAPVMISNPWHKFLQTLFIFPLHPVPHLMSIGWTLSVEWLFYVLFFLLILFKRRKKALLLIIMIVLLVLTGYIARFRDSRLIFITNPVLLEFLPGVIICRAYILVKNIPKLLAIGFVLAGAGIYVYEIFHGFGYISEMASTVNGSLSMKRFLFWGLPSSLLVAGCVFLEKNAVGTRLWNNKWIRLTGDASYSIYLVHLIVFFLLSLVFQRVKYFAIPDAGIILQLAVAMITGIIFYLFVERPLLRLVRRKARQQPAAVSIV